MNQVETKDGSVTFFNEKYEEHYHTTSGAEEESLKKYAAPLQDYVKDKHDLVLLDVCFGLGYNTAAAIDIFAGKHHTITIYALENDMGIISKMDDLDTSFASFFLLKKAVKDALATESNKAEFMYKETPITLYLYIGDARETIFNAKGVHGVLFDPFSPKKHPEMWAKEFFEKIKNVMTPGAALTTYSCARSFRDTLRELDFEVVNGPCIGRRAPSTIGVKKDVKID